MKDLLRDRVRLVKSDGTIIEDIKASVQTDMVFMNDPNLPIEEGDRIQRTLPNQLEESYLVLDRGFMQGMGGIKSHYQTKVRKESAIPAKATDPSVVIHQHGHASRINVGSVDNSANTVSVESTHVFQQVRQQLHFLRRRVN